MTRSISLVFLALLLVQFAALSLQQNPNLIQLDNILNGPSTMHLLGADELGRDVLSRLAAGMRVSVVVGFCVLVISGVIGISVGVLSGWIGGWVDQVLMRITDVFLSFPGILIAITLAALAGPGIENVIFALGFMGWVTFARLARIQTIAMKNDEYIQAARLCGVGATRIVSVYVLPNISAPLLVEGAFTMAGAILAESGLSFLGVGIQAPDPSLGSMLREGARYMMVAPHLVLFPGMVLMLLVLLLNLIGDRLRIDIR